MTTIRSEIDVSRRAFAIGAASAVAGLTIGFRWASAQAPQGGPTRAAHDPQAIRSSTPGCASPPTAASRS